MMLCGKTMYIWGTGSKGEEALQQMQVYRKVYKELLNESLEIEAFVDSNRNKAKHLFHGYKVLFPEQINVDVNKDFFIVAVWQRKNIMLSLKYLGYHKKNVMFFEDFFQALKNGLMEHRKAILVALLKKKTVNGITRQCIDQACNSPNCWESLSNQKSIYQAILISEISEEIKNILYDILLSRNYLLFNNIDDKKGKSFWNALKSTFPLSNIVSAASFYFGSSIGKLVDYINAFDMLETKPNKIKTIGIHDERYYNGGAERFLSLIMPVYIRLGYRVIFFTDEYNPSEEYELPKDVLRIVLQNSYIMDRTARFQELVGYIHEYNIDIMCFHNQINEEEFCYEFLLLKLMNVFVLAESHLMFIMLLTTPNNISKQLVRLYPLVDQLIVLSRYDKKFWTNLGCRAEYIPNPMIVNKIHECGIIPKHDKIILWIGRIEQSGKRVLDVIDIIKIVRKQIPNIKLKLVGGISNKDVYMKLKSEIIKENMTDIIDICGYHTDVSKYYQMADIMLFTSKMESFSLVIAESKIYGVPLVLYELPYLELLQEKKGYIAVPQRGVQEAANALIHVLSNPSCRMRLSNEAKESILPFIQYDIAAAWKKIFESFAKPLVKKDFDEENEMVEKLLLQEICTGDM